MSDQLAPKNNPEIGIHNRIHFGKYEGTTFNNLLSLDPFYLTWVVDEVEWLKITDEAFNKLQEGSILGKFWSMPFGNYNGRKLHWILKNDLSYFVWIVDGLLPVYPNIELSEDLLEEYELAIENAGDMGHQSYNDISFSF